MTVMNRDELIDALKAMVVRECDKDMEPGEIDAKAQLIGGELELDSLDALQIAMAVKTEYGVRIEGGPDGRRAMQSVASLADFIIEAKSAEA